MKRKLVLIFSVINFCVLGLLAFRGMHKVLKNQEREKVLSSSDAIFKNLGISSSKDSRSTLLIYFNSKCEHCQWEVYEIANNRHLFENTQLAFVSHEPKEQAKAYLSQYGLTTNYLDVDVDKVMNTFSGSVPQLFIYEDGQLKKHFKGEVKIEAILKVLNN